MTMTNDQKLLRLVEIHHEQQELKARMAELSDERDRLDRDIRETWLDTMTRSQTIGDDLVYTRRDYWAQVTADNRAAAAEAMSKEPGWEHLPKPHIFPQSLTAFVRERAIAAGLDGAPPEDWEALLLPETLKPLVQIGRRSNLRVKKARRS